MSRERIKSLLQELKSQMEERKPNKGSPSVAEGVGDLPASMTPITSGGMGGQTAELANRTIDRISENLPEACKGKQAEKIIAKEAANTIEKSSSMNSMFINAANNLLSSKGSKAISKVTDLINSNPLGDISEILSERPDQIIYNKLISNVGAMFLSDNPNDYIAAMLGMTQESIRADTNAILAEMDSIKSAINSYVEALRRQVEHLANVRTFPNLVQILVQMQEEMTDVLEETAALQGRILTAGNFGSNRINSVTSKIHDVLEKNSRISQALGIYDPDAKLDMDIKSFAKYMEKRIKDLLNKVKNMADFKSKFQADINPLDIFYKNFARLYQYICKAYERVNDNATNWRSSKIATLKANCSIINEKLYSSLVIFDQLRQSNLLTAKEQPVGSEDGTVVGRFLQTLFEGIHGLDFVPIITELNEMLYVVNALATQGALLLKAPFETFKEEVFERGLPDNILSLVNFEAVRNGDWKNVLNVNDALKINLKDIATEKMLQKCQDINIPLGKLPKLEVLNSLKNRFNNSCNNIKSEVTSINNVVNNPSQPNLKEVLPPSVSESVKNMATLSPSVNTAFKNADVSKFSGAISSPECSTREGEAAMNLKGTLSGIEEEDITVNERDAINRAITLLSGDHIQQCADALLKAEGFGETMTFSVNIDEYVTEVYDNVNSILEWLLEISTMGGEDIETTKSSGGSVSASDLKQNILTTKG